MAIEAPLLEQIIARIASRLPESEERVNQWLSTQVHGGRTLDLAAVERAARYRREPMPFAVLRRQGASLVLAPDQLSLAARTMTIATRWVHRGPALLSQLAVQVGTGDLAMVARIVSLHVAFVWVDKALRWFWFRTRSCRLAEIAVEVVASEGPQSEESLLRKLEARAGASLALPDRVLSSFLSLLPQLKLKGDLYFLTSEAEGTTTRGGAPQAA